MPRPIHVLIAEDEPGDRLLLECAFNQIPLHISVYGVSDGQQAIEYLKRSTRSRHNSEHRIPNLLLLDLKMPKVDGLEVLKWVRRNARLSHIQVVVFTASEDGEDMRQSYEAGADAYVVKPQDPDEFIEVVRDMEKHWLDVHATPECGCVFG